MCSFKIRQFSVWRTFGRAICSELLFLFFGCALVRRVRLACAISILTDWFLMFVMFDSPMCCGFGSRKGLVTTQTCMHARGTQPHIPHVTLTCHNRTRRTSANRAWAHASVRMHVAHVSECLIHASTFLPAGSLTKLHRLPFQSKNQKREGRAVSCSFVLDYRVIIHT